MVRTQNEHPRWNRTNTLCEGHVRQHKCSKDLLVCVTYWCTPPQKVYRTERRVFLDPSQQTVPRHVVPKFVRLAYFFLLRSCPMNTIQNLFFEKPYRQIDRQIADKWTLCVILLMRETERFQMVKKTLELVQQRHEQKIGQGQIEYSPLLWPLTSLYQTGRYIYKGNK